MGNESMHSNQILSQSVIKAQWTFQNQQGILLVRNNFSGAEFQIKMKRMVHQDIKLYLLREKYSFAHTPKVMIYELNTVEQNILIEYAPNKIQNCLQKRNISEVQLINEMNLVLKALQLLVKKHGCFYVSEAMLRSTKNNDIVVWFHQDFSNNNPQFPLPNGQGQQPMISKVCKVYEKYLSETNKISPCSTFAQARGKIQQKMVTIRNQMIYHTPRKSQLQVNHLNSTRSYSNVISPVQMSVLYSSSQSINENKSLQTRPYTNNSRENVGGNIPIIHQSQQYPVSHPTQNVSPAEFRNKISISHFAKPMNPQQNIKHSRTKISDHNNYKKQSIAQGPNLTKIRLNQNASQRSSIDSQYTKNFNQNIFQPQTVNPLNFNIRGTNQSNASSYQSSAASRPPLFQLKPCQETPEKDFLISSPTSFCKKPSYSMQQSASKTLEIPTLSPKVSLLRSSNETGQQELSPSDFNISNSHITDELNTDFNGVFGSNKSIHYDSQIGSPLKRQINSDLRKLFF